MESFSASGIKCKEMRVNRVRILMLKMMSLFSDFQQLPSLLRKVREWKKKQKVSRLNFPFINILQSLFPLLIDIIRSNKTLYSGVVKKYEACFLSFLRSEKYHLSYFKYFMRLRRQRVNIFFHEKVWLSWNWELFF